MEGREGIVVFCLLGTWAFEAEGFGIGFFLMAGLGGVSGQWYPGEKFVTPLLYASAEGRVETLFAFWSSSQTSPNF